MRSIDAVIEAAPAVMHRRRRSLERDEFIIARQLLYLSMIFSENRCPLFRTMLYAMVLR
jgi:hypothetical protein